MASRTNFAVSIKLLTDQFKKQVNGIQAQMKGLANTIKGAFAGLGAISLGREFIQTVRDFQDGMARVRAVTNASAEDFKIMSKEARRLGGTTVYTAAQAAEALENLTRNGLSATDATKVLGKTLNFAQANVISMADAAMIMTNNINAFNLGVENAERVADVLSTTASHSATNVLELGEALKIAAPIAGVVGMSIEETNAALATLAKVGIKGSDAGTGVKQVLIQIAKQTPKAKKALKEFGVSMSESELKAKGLGYILEKLAGSGIGTNLEALANVFGKLAAPRAAALIQNYEMFNDLQVELRKSQGTTARMMEQSIGEVTKAIKLMISAWQEFMIAGGENGLNGPLIQSLTIIKDIITWLSGNIKVVVSTLTGLFASIGVAKLVNGLTASFQAFRAKEIAGYQTQTAIYQRELNKRTLLYKQHKDLEDKIAQASGMRKRLLEQQLSVVSTSLEKQKTVVQAAESARRTALVRSEQAAQTGLFASIRVAGVMCWTSIKAAIASTGIGLLIVAIGTAVSFLIGKLTEAYEKSQEFSNRIKRTASEQKNAFNEGVVSIKKSGASVRDEMKRLAKEWKAAGTESEKNKMIARNQEAFRQLSLNIKNATDAEKAFGKNTGNVCNALAKRAEYLAGLDALKDANAELIDAKVRGSQRKYGVASTKTTVSQLNDSEIKAAGINLNLSSPKVGENGAESYARYQFEKNYKKSKRYLTPEEAKKVNEYRRKVILEQNKKILKIYEDRLKQTKKLVEQSTLTPEEEKTLSGITGSLYGDDFSGGSGGDSGSGSSKVNKRKQAEETYNQALEEAKIEFEQGAISQKEMYEKIDSATKSYIMSLAKLSDKNEADEKLIDELNEKRKVLIKEITRQTVEEARVRAANELILLDRRKELGMLKKSSDYYQKLYSSIEDELETLLKLEDQNEAVKEAEEILVEDLNKISKQYEDALKIEKKEKDATDAIAKLKEETAELLQKEKKTIRKEEEMYLKNIEAGEGKTKLRDREGGSMPLGKWFYRLFGFKRQDKLDRKRDDISEQITNKKDLRSEINSKMVNLATKIGDSEKYLNDARNNVTGYENKVNDKSIDEKVREEFTEKLKDAKEKLTKAEKEYNSTVGEGNKQIDTYKSQITSLTEEISGLENKLNAVGNGPLQTLHEGLGNFQEQVNGIDSMVSAFDSLTESIKNNASAWDIFKQALSTVMSIVSGTIAVMNIISSISSLFAAKKKGEAAATSADAIAKGSEAAATTANAGALAAETPALIANAAASKTASAALQELAAAQIFAAHASIPFAGVGIATGLITQMQGVMLGLKAIDKFADGGIVGGSSYSGDKILARVNSKEMILNGSQQANLFRAINSGNLGSGGGTVDFQIKGDTLYGVLKNHGKLKSKIGKDTGIN